MDQPDVVWWSEMYLDLTRPWPMPPGSIDRIFGDNVIKHFPLDVARAVLRHCHDALRAGGAIRLATPDVERIAPCLPGGPPAHRRPPGPASAV